MSLVAAPPVAVLPAFLTGTTPRQGSDSDASPATTKQMDAVIVTDADVPMKDAAMQLQQTSPPLTAPLPPLPPPPPAIVDVDMIAHGSSCEASSTRAGSAPAACDAASLPRRERSLRCRDISRFVTLKKLGEGVYGSVSLARDRDSGEVVAVKHIKPATMYDRDGVPLWFIRELRALRALQHPNIVRMLEIVTSPPSDDNSMLGGTYMVFELAERTLDALSNMPDRRLPAEHVRSFMHQLLSALAFMKTRGWVHRDLKPANILLSKSNEIKVADLGLAREMSLSRRQMSPEVVTLWYRAPELLYGYHAADYGVDVWSAGCVFAEMLLGRPLFAAADARTLIDRIYALCGVPSVTTWPGLRSCDRYEALRPLKNFTPQFNTKFQGFDPQAVHLLEQLLTLSPTARITAEAALQHPYFKDAPVVPAASLPAWPPVERPMTAAAPASGSSVAPATAGVKRPREEASMPAPATAVAAAPSVRPLAVLRTMPGGRAGLPFGMRPSTAAAPPAASREDDDDEADAPSSMFLTTAPRAGRGRPGCR